MFSFFTVKRSKQQETVSPAEFTALLNAQARLVRTWLGAMDENKKLRSDLEEARREKSAMLVWNVAFFGLIAFLNLMALLHAVAK